MDTYTLRDGYSCCGGITVNGWYAGALLLEDLDREFTVDLPHTDRKVRILDGKTLDEWESSMLCRPRRLVLVKGFGGEPVVQAVAEAERIYGPVSPVSPVTAAGAPVLLWTELRERVWRLMLFQGGETRAVYESSTKLRSPAVAETETGCIVACETEYDGETVVLFFDSNGSVQSRTVGRAPKLTAINGVKYLLSETLSDRRSVVLTLSEIGDEGVRRSSVLQSDDLNFGGSIAAAPDTGCVLVSWESTPSWGVDPSVGRHRDLNLWSCRPGEEPIPADGTFEGKIDVPREAYFDNHHSNMPATHQQIVLLDGRPSIAYRRFRYRGNRCFGWDVYLMEYDDSRWSAPRRVSEHVGPPDAGYSLLASGNDIIGVFPCCDNEPGSRRTSNHRIEVQRIAREEFIEHTAVPFADRGFYVVPFAVNEPAPDPPAPGGADIGGRLIWGDVHSHSLYSKCMSSIDGSPGDVLRYQRDVLGCSVLTLTDHTHQMGAQEFTWHLDRMEACAGENSIVVYGCEPGTRPDHHTNFYAIDRCAIEMLRPIVLSYWERNEMYAAIKERLPAGSIIALRHFHGMSQGLSGICGNETVTTWDPELEVAMEAMQVRGNIMLGEFPNERKVPGVEMPRFPANFLSAGAEIGLVGGSDHSTGMFPNHFCLTGFWVRERTPESVWEAIRNRRTIACSNGKISLWTELEEQPMGSKVSVKGAVSIRVRATAPRRIERLYLLRDGEPLAATEVDSCECNVELVDRAPEPGRHWYAVTAEGESAFQDERDKTAHATRSVRTGARTVAHASPYFVTTS